MVNLQKARDSPFIGLKWWAFSLHHNDPAASVKLSLNCKISKLSKARIREPRQRRPFCWDCIDDLLFRLYAETDPRMVLLKKNNEQPRCNRRWAHEAGDDSESGRS